MTATVTNPPDADMASDGADADDSRMGPAMTWATMDGNEAAARVAHRLSEVVAIYPITPASPMGELADAWSVAGRPNLWDGVPDVIEMQMRAQHGVDGVRRIAGRRQILQKARLQHVPVGKHVARFVVAHTGVDDDPP